MEAFDRQLSICALKEGQHMDILKMELNFAIKFRAH